jgi:hypothetical protein
MGSEQMSTDLSTQRLLQLRLIIGSMIVGVVAFAVVSVVLAGDAGLGQTESNRSFEQILLVAVGVAGLSLLMVFPFVRRTILNRLRSEWRGGTGPALEDSRLLSQFQVLTIVGAAMAEGFALFATVIYLLTAANLALVGTAIGVVMLGRLFPSANALADFASEVTRPSVS